MRTLISLFLIIAFMAVEVTMGQSPQKLNYQAVVRGVSGNPITNTSIGVRLSILQGSSTGSPVCIEEFSTVTNAYGLVTLEIGSVNTIEFEAIDWSAGPYYLKVELDETGGSAYTEIGTNQLMSVPYALHALTVGNFEGEIIIDNTGVAPNSEQVRFFSNGTEMSRLQSYTSDEQNAMMVFSNVSSGTLTEHMRLTSAGNLGIGTSSPQTKLNISGGTDASLSAGSGYFQIGPVNGQNILMDDNEIMSRNNGSESILSLQNDGGDLIVHHNVASGTEFIVKDNGNVGIGILAPENKLTIDNGTDVSTSTGGFLQLGASDNYNIGFDDNEIMARNNGVPGRLCLQREGGELSVHDMSAEGTQFIVKEDGKVGFGTINPSSRFELATGSSWSDETPLFEVKNNDGITVFAVYNNGVRVTVEDDPAKKGPKGGFAIGGFDPTKSGETVDFMRVTTDSIRFNIDNTSSKGPKGGFAIGGFDRTKGTINEDFMYVTPQGSSTGGYNTSLGYQSGYSLAGGFHNVMVGYRAGYKTDGYYISDFLCDGTRNIFIGNYAGYDNVSGKDNIAVGYEAGRKILGNENIYIGTSAGKDLTGSRNIIIGKYTDGWFGSEEDDNFVLSNGTGGTPLLAGNFSQRVIAIDGNLYVYDAYDNNVSGADLYIASNGMVGTLASSRRFKENITAMDDISWFYELEPVEFSYIEEPLHARQYGLIAEEVEKIDPYFVSYDQEGEVYTVTYSRFISPMIKVIQEQDDRISSLESEIDQLRQMVMEIAGAN